MQVGISLLLSILREGDGLPCFLNGFLEYNFSLRREDLHSDAAVIV